MSSSVAEHEDESTVIKIAINWEVLESLEFPQGARAWEERDRSPEPSDLEKVSFPRLSPQTLPELNWRGKKRSRIVAELPMGLGPVPISLVEARKRLSDALQEAFL